VMGSNPSATKGGNLPVTNVSWYDCQAFFKKLNASVDRGYRLPTEAEWEYACRAGTDTAYSFGELITEKNANFDSKIGKPVSVGSYSPNAFKLHEMHGNVCEWCGDWFNDYPSVATADPIGPETGKYLVIRGGSFDFIPSSTRSAYRETSLPSSQYNYLGFRLARTK